MESVGRVTPFLMELGKSQEMDAFSVHGVLGENSSDLSDGGGGFCAVFGVFGVSTVEHFLVRSLDQEWRMKDHEPMKRDDKTW